MHAPVISHPSSVIRKTKNKSVSKICENPRNLWQKELLIENIILLIFDL